VFGQVYTDAKPTLRDEHAKPGEDAKLYPYFPHHARVRNLTYQIECSVDFSIEKRKRYGNKPGYGEGDLMTNFEKKNKITLCDIPVMVHSKPCHLWGLSEK
jgi:DNA-directed RNA polymerase beta subunit